MSTILFYISNHGSHSTRLKCLLPYLKEHKVIIISSIKEEIEGVISIYTPPLQHEKSENLYKPECFHPTPLNGSSSAHFLPLVKAIDTYQADIAVVDVSVEAALLCRLMGIPYVCIRQSGKRDDLPHELMYEAAVGMIAAYPLFLEDGTYVYKNRTYYTGGFSRLGPVKGLQYTNHPTQILVMPGSGGTNLTPSLLEEWAINSPHFQWKVLAEGEDKGNIQYLGRVKDVKLWMTAADVIVANAGNNTVMEIATLRKPYLCIPDNRPFDEQVYKALALSTIGAVEVCRYPPKPYEIEDLITKSSKRNMNFWEGVINPFGARDFVKAIEQYIHQSQVSLNPSAQTPV